MGNHKTGKNLICGICSKEFYVIKCRLNKDKPIYCSISCKGKAYWNEYRKYPKTIGTCLYCKGDIIAKDAAFDKPNRKYCSARCRTIVNNKTMVWSPKMREGAAKRAKIRFTGTTATKQRKERQSLSNLGSKSHFWKGGLTKENRKLRNSYKTKEWRKAVFERDNYICQVCNIRGTKLEADHIKSWSKFPELRWDINNGRTLCKPCHRKTDNFGAKNNKK